MAMGDQELKDILDKHRKWVYSEPGGERANLTRANLTRANLDGANLYGANLDGANLTRANLYGANLTRANLDGANLDGANLDGANLDGANLDGANLDGANLTRANLDGANLTRANLYGANLTRANLYGANLTRANLYGANLTDTKNDFFQRLALAKNEVAGLYDYLKRGLVDGSSYTATCACFVGTVAKVAKEAYENLSCGLKPDADSATERWFLGIKEGDTPVNSKISALTCEWVEEFAKDNSILLPSYKLISSAEFPAAFQTTKPTSMPGVSL